MLRGELYVADDPDLATDHARAQELPERYNAIGDNVWLGGGTIVCPGVTIGDDTVVGAGAVVTRDLPAGVVATGTSARARREIGDRDRVSLPGA